MSWRPERSFNGHCSLRHPALQDEKGGQGSVQYMKRIAQLNVCLLGGVLHLI